MLRIIKAPSKYVQGKDAIEEFNLHTAHLGQSFYVITSTIAEKLIRKKLERSLKNSARELVFEIYDGISSISEINRIAKAARASGCTTIVGAGGGNAVDTAKAVAFLNKMPLVVIPTVASSDAPCSALSVMYTDDGEFSHYQYYPANPNLVLVDTNIIVGAPVRFFVAGMGDALSTYFEARACLKNVPDNPITNAGVAIAKRCYNILIENGCAAKLAVSKKCVTPAVENVIEANIYLSGVGFENTGLAAAHMFYNGTVQLAECKNFMHGEIVAFGTAVQLVADNCAESELKDVFTFCTRVGLPVTLGDIGITDVQSVELAARDAIERTKKDRLITAHVGEQEFYDAIIVADALGREFKSKYSPQNR